MPEDIETAESPLALAQRALAHVTSTKAWGLSKAESIAADIDKAGGVPTDEMAQVLEQLQAASAN